MGFCLALLLGSPSGEARAAVDWLQYIASYVDLVRAFGPDPTAGEWHFQTYGRAEGRAADAFDEAQYLANYPDLQAAFGGDTQAATVHFIRYSAYEGRADAPLARRGGSILLVIADDYGVDAAGFYPVGANRRDTVPPAPPTPNLQALAQRGILFRDAWANMDCSPTRASLLTGRYEFRHGVGAYVRNADEGYPTLPYTEVTLPRLFQGSGYLLAHVGKWHLDNVPYAAPTGTAGPTTPAPAWGRAAWTTTTAGRRSPTVPGASRRPTRPPTR